MTIRLFAPNLKTNAFPHNWEFWGKILIFENTLNTTEKQEIQTIYLKKKKTKQKKKTKTKNKSRHIYSLILSNMCSMVYITKKVMIPFSKAEFDKNMDI